MPRSPFFARLADLRSPAGRPRENIDLISRHRSAKIAERLAQEVDVIHEKTQAALSQIGREEKLPPQMKFRR
jgi:hypothetical protein